MKLPLAFYLSAALAAVSSHRVNNEESLYLFTNNSTHSFPSDTNIFTSFLDKHYGVSHWCEKSQNSSGNRRILLCKRPERSGNATVQLKDAAELLAALPVPAASAVERGRSRYQASTVPLSAGQCHLVMFFMSSCQFSARSAPSFNALARHVPDIQLLALDVEQSRSVSTRFGVVSVPMFVLFHDGRPAAMFNDSEPTLAALGGFVRHTTNVSVSGMDERREVSEEDLLGPVSCGRSEDRVDQALLMAWLFVAASGVYWGVRCRVWARMVQTVDTWWREAELHLHNE